MKNFILLLISTIFSHLCFAQTGPGGVGNSSSNILWLDASTIALSNNDPVTSWLDISGNGNNATQISITAQPRFKSNQLNTKAAVEFDGTTDFLDLTNHITSAELSFYSVFKANLGGPRTILSTNKHWLRGRNINGYALYNAQSTISKNTTSYSSFSLISDGTPSSTFTMNCDNNQGSFSRTSFRNEPKSAVGAYYQNLTTTNRYIEGSIPEIIVFNIQLNSAQNTIVNNYLASKYAVEVPNDLYTYDVSFGNGLIGIGQEADGNNTSARGKDSLLLKNASSLGDGDYVFIGNNNGEYTTTSSGPTTTVERWNRVWRVDLTGTPGTVDLEFFLGSNGFGAISDYAVLIERIDGDFSNGGTILHEIGRSYDAINNSITFTGINFLDGDYFTLAEKQGDIISIRDGLWNATSTWNCGCIPVANSIVTIENTHDVDISVNAEAYNLTIATGGSLTFSGSDTLYMHNELLINGTLNSGDGTISAVKSTTTQSFENNSGIDVEFYNLYINNNSGLNLLGGVWSLANNLQVTAGGLDVSGSDGITLISNSSNTSQILPSMNSAFTGNYTIQRYISSRNANYANLSSPINSATVSDLDDDLYLSGVNGIDGNATISGGGIFYSMYFFDYVNDLHQEITSTATSLPPAKGFEVYLADNQTTFNGATIDYIGKPNNGNYSVTVDPGWNLVGNPYHAPLNFDDIINRSWVPNEYYIFNSDNGSYDFFSGSSKPSIAPGQGFWFVKNIAGTSSNGLLFKESAKGNSNTSDFLRKKASSNFELGISSQLNQFKHQMSLGFTPYSTKEIDDQDALYLKSPIETAPAIYSKATNSPDGLILNSLNSFEESQLIPIEIYTGVQGIYSIEASNLEHLYDNFSCIYLKDKANNQAIDLSVNPTYQFETTVGTSDRFQLLLSNSYVECEKLIDNGSFEQKFDHSLSLRNGYGNWYLDYTLDERQNQVEIHIYNMAGQEILAPISFTASNAGTYPLQDLQNLKGIFLIQVRTKDGFLNKTVKL